MLLSQMIVLCLFLFGGFFSVLPVYALDPSSDPILRIETGSHLTNISDAATDRAGKLIATASADKTVRLWEAGTGRLLNTLRVPIDDEREGILLSVAVSPDGRFVATGGITGRSWDNSQSIYFFDVASGQMIKRVSGISYVIRSIKFSPDGQFVAVASGETNGETVVILASSGQVVARHAFAASCEAVDISSQGQMAVLTKNNQLHLFKTPVASDPQQIVLSGNDPPVSCAFHPKGHRIAVGFAASLNVELIELSDLSRKINKADIRGQRLSVGEVTWSRNGEFLWAAGQPGSESAAYRLVFAWGDEGMGAESRLTVPGITKVSKVLQTGQGNLFFAVSQSGIGEIDPQGKLVYSKTLLRPSYQKNHDYFATSADGTIIRFSYSPYGKDGAAFNITSRTFVKTETVDDVVAVPVRTTEQIDLQHWDSWGKQGKLIPSLNKRPLRGFGNTRDKPMSFGIAPDGESFFIGAYNTIRRYDRFGRLLWRALIHAPALSMAVSKDGRFLIVALADGTIRWFSQHEGREQMAFFPHPDKKRWVLWTPEGYFDASPGGSELVGYHINQGKDREARFISMSYLYDVFYRPDIIQARLKGDDIGNLVTLTADEALKSPPPAIKFTKVPDSTAEQKVTICYQVKSSGGGIGEVRLFQNGKLIRSDGYYREVAKRENTDKVQLASVNSRTLYSDMRSLAVKDRKAAGAAITSKKGDQVDECLELETISGENEISLAAFNGPNSVQSFMNTVSFDATRKADEPHLYILSVGIDKYRDTGITLKYAAKDARDFIARLPQKARSIYKPENIHLITLANEQAGKQNILKTINDLAVRVKHGDGFVFFNASHGVLLQNQYYIVTSDFNGDLGNADSLISSNEIVEISKKIKSLSQLFIFDTCHAGGVDNIVSGLYDARMSVLAKKMGLHIFASAGSVQTAMDGYRGNGLYTHTLLQGMEGAGGVDIDKNGTVTVKDLGQYSKEKTTELSTRLGHPQTPLIISFGRDKPLFVIQ